MTTRGFRDEQTAAATKRRARSFRKGQIAVVMTLVITTLVGVIALGGDVAVIYYNWMQLQKSADASALAGATYFLTQNTTRTLPTPTINAGCTYATQQQNVACTYALNNFAQSTDLTPSWIVALFSFSSALLPTFALIAHAPNILLQVRAAVSAMVRNFS
jgi:endonuclease/exonuclease/phosphatase (EEP) superfamily protein YafD